MKDRMEDIDNKLMDYLHNELDADERKAMDLLLEADTDLQAEFQHLKYTVINPDEQIVFADKTLLLKPEPRKIRPLRNWIAWGVAASLLTAVSMFVLKNLDSKPEKPMDENLALKSSSHIQPPVKATTPSDVLSGKPSQPPAVPKEVRAKQAIAPTSAAVKKNHLPVQVGVNRQSTQNLPTQKDDLDGKLPKEEVIESNSIVEVPAMQVPKEMEITLPTVDIVQHRLLEKEAEPAFQKDIANQSQYQQAAREKNTIRLDAGKQPALMKSINGALGFFRRIRKAGDDLRRREVVVTLSRKKHDVY